MSDVPPVDVVSEYSVSNPADLPKKPVEASEELRQQMRTLAKKDLYYLCKVVLGYDKMVPHVHMPMCRFSNDVKAKRRLRLMPRTHYKTTIWTIGETIQDIVKDCNITILLIADTGTNASRFMREIQQHFEMNELFRWLFSELIPNNFKTTTWSQTEMIIPRTRVCREPTVDAIGAGGGVESRHYDKIRADDLVTEKCIHSDVEMDKLNRWAGGLESLLVSVIEGQIDWTGSRKKKGDLYDTLEKKYGDGFETQEIGPHANQMGDLAVFWRRDIENGVPIFPEQVSMRFLMRLKKWDPERYHAQYANSPKGSGLNTFEDEDLRYWRWSTDGRLIECVHDGQVLMRMSPWAGERIVLYDPSIAKHKGSSQNSILVLLRGHPLPFRIVLETHIGHYPPDEAVRLLFEMDKKWRPTVISVEHRGFQGAVKYWMNEKAEREDLPYPPLRSWPPQGSPKAQWAKDEHVKACQPLVRNNFVWLHKSQTELIEQFEFHPNVRWDDGVDSFSQSLDYWPALMSEMEILEHAQSEKDMIEQHIGVYPIERYLTGKSVEEKHWDEQKWLSSLNATGYMQNPQGR